jgi:hypothetical protein
MKYLIFLTCIICKINCYGQTLHLITVGALDDKNLSSAVFSDIEMINKNFNFICKNINYKLSSKVIGNKDFDSKSILNTLDTLSVESQDIIFFYYSGHGYNDLSTNSRFPIFQLNDFKKYKLLVDKVSEILQAKNARLSITFGDMCNNFLINSEKGFRKTITVKGGIVSNDMNPVLRKLFIDAKGNIKIASSEKSQYSNAYQDGSLYTKAFDKALEEAMDKNNEISWMALLEDAQQRLEQLLPDKVQRSIYDINGQIFPPDVTPIQPEPVVNFAQINKYLNYIADENVESSLRQKIIQEANQYFVENAQVKVFVNETETESQTINKLLKRLYLNAANIREVNLIEKMSLLENNLKKYKTIAVQEVWKN